MTDLKLTVDRIEYDVYRLHVGDKHVDLDDATAVQLIESMEIVDRAQKLGPVFTGMLNELLGASARDCRVCYGSKPAGPSGCSNCDGKGFI